jgi:hypothetical protein
MPDMDDMPWLASRIINDLRALDSKLRNYAVRKPRINPLIWLYILILQ